MLPAHTRDRVISLRTRGATFAEITAATGVQKSTISYMVRRVALSAEHLADRRARKVENGRRTMAKRSAEERSKIGARGGRSCQLRHGAKVTRAMLRGKGWIVSGLTYRQDELGLLKRLNDLYNTSFQKEQVGRLFLDFANSTTVIEVTHDPATGITDLTKRFELLGRRRDKRRRIAYIPRALVESPRRSHLRDELGVELLDVSALHNGA